MCSCEKPYTGRTVGELHNRINRHRSSYKEVLKKAETNTLEEIDATSDEYALGLHLYLDHGLTYPNAFDAHVKRYHEERISVESTRSSHWELMLSILSGYHFWDKINK